MPEKPQRWEAVLRVLGALGKTLGALLAVGVVAALFGKGTLAIVLLVIGAVGAAVGVLAPEGENALERARARRALEKERDAELSERDRAIEAALRTAVCCAADVSSDAIGVDPVDPRVLERALRVDGEQLAYVHRDVDARLRKHLG